MRRKIPNLSRGRRLITVYVRFSTSSGDASPRQQKRRSPWLERLLARADECVRVVDWREDAFRRVANGKSVLPAVGAVALIAAERDPSAGSGVAGDVAAMNRWAYLATPLHCVAAMTSVGLPPGGILRLDPSEAAALAEDFSRRLGTTPPRLIAGPQGTLVCVFDGAVAADTVDPWDIVGQSIGPHLPAGRDGPRLRQVMSEIEMWLHEHAVNRRRAAAGELPITGLWLWGGGPTAATLPHLPASVAGDDALFSAWPRAATDPAAASRPEQLKPPLPESQLVVLPLDPGAPDWDRNESQWIVPAARGLRAGRVDRLDLCAAHHRYSVGAGWAWRIWRRPRPWWEYFE